MDWNKLFSEKRERPSSTKMQPYRNCFDMDYDRIVYSSSLRRLQDKAQVFPLQENDFTRTRLTHSLEVSAIGKSMGANVGYQLRKKEIFDEEMEKKLSSLLLVAGLVHDLGNPPFGHYGEDVIKEWFKDKKEDLISRKINEDELRDFISFDGNAQTIRILTRLQFLNDRYGMNFCYGTLATLMKYPWASNSSNNVKDKFGYFLSEEKFCEEIIKETGIITRHPATYLLEAADDIAYLFADIEDALKKHYVPWTDVFEEFKQKVKSIDAFKRFEYIVRYIESKRERNNANNVSGIERDLIDIQNFKILAQGYLIETVCNEFVSCYDLIMQGKYEKKALLENEEAREFVHFIRRKCIKYAYQNKEVLSLELVGKEVLENLLQKFVYAALDDGNYKKPKTANGKLYALISDNFKFIQYFDEKGEHNPEKELTPYQRVQMVVDFISGMTDSYALNLHKTLMGM